MDTNVDMKKVNLKLIWEQEYFKGNGIWNSIQGLYIHVGLFVFIWSIYLNKIFKII